MPHPPHDMPKDERLEEISQLLSHAILRLNLQRMRKSNHFRDIPLDSSPDQSVYANHAQGDKP